MKKVAEKKEKAGVEKYWQRLVKVYFDIYKENFKDSDGYPLEPNWKGPLVGMESKALKLIIIRLREIAEAKNFDWTEMYAVDQLTIFFKKALLKPFLAKSFQCCLLNKYKDELIVSEYVNPMVNKILELFYQINPNYAADKVIDRGAGEIIVGFLKANFLRANILFEEKAVLQSVRTIFIFVRQDPFWKEKSLKSISNNLQEFVNKIKSNANGQKYHGSNGHRIEPGIKSEKDFGEL